MDSGMLGDGRAVWVVFTNVLLQQLGLPLPAIPTMLVAGSQSAASGYGPLLLLAAVLASLLADVAWYFVGRAFGYRVLNGLCRLSINPSSCVTQTEGRFVRWGVWSLIVGKFVPGFSTVAPPIAGALRMSLPGFIAAAALGAALWAGVALAAGYLLREQVDQVIEMLARQGWVAALVVALLLGGWLAWKLWQRHRFRQMAKMPHMLVEELLQALRSDAPPRLLDFRGRAQLGGADSIRGAHPANIDSLLEQVSAWPKTTRLVTLCACPHDATAVHAARLLIKAGYPHSLPLRDGQQVWTRLRDELSGQP